MRAVFVAEVTLVAATSTRRLETLPPTRPRSNTAVDAGLSTPRPIMTHVVPDSRYRRTAVRASFGDTVIVRIAWSTPRTFFVVTLAVTFGRTVTVV